MRDVAVLAVNGVLPSDLGIACDTFARAELSDGKAAYRMRVCGEATEVAAGAFSVRAPWTLDDLVGADTVVVPGIEDPSRPAPADVIVALRAAWERNARIVSICTGAFVLAAAGLLDGRRATTHWRFAAELARRYPGVSVDPDVLFVDEGRIVTSAGASAGLDMCLHLVRRDHGQAVAAHTARLALAPLNREGGQAQFIRQEAPISRASLAPLLDWMLENLSRPLDVEMLADKAGMSARTFARRFPEQTGATPAQWLLTARVRRAQELLETTAAPIDRVASATGFESPVTFRGCFRRVIGLSPAAYRRRFKVDREAGNTL